jgi:putative FmdB family regulatory protein
MPLYDFKCNACSDVFEVWQTISNHEKPLSEPCPKCSVRGQIERLYGANPFIDSVKLGVRQPDRTFQREVLGKIAKNNPRSNIGKGKFHIPGRVG